MSNHEQLNKLEQQIEALREELNEREKRVNARIDSILAAKELPPAPTTTKVYPQLQGIKIGTLEPVKIQESGVGNSTSSYSTRSIDRRLGSFYGSADLREAIKDAQGKMHVTVGHLQKVRDNTHSLFVRKEIEHTFERIRILTNIFNRMLDRMELPDCCDDIILAADSPDPTSMSKELEGDDKI